MNFLLPPYDIMAFFIGVFALIYIVEISWLVRRSLFFKDNALKRMYIRFIAWVKFQWQKRAIDYGGLFIVACVLSLILFYILLILATC